MSQNHILKADGQPLPGEYSCVKAQLLGAFRKVTAFGEFLQAAVVDAPYTNKSAPNLTDCLS